MGGGVGAGGGREASAGMGDFFVGFGGGVGRSRRGIGVVMRRIDFDFVYLMRCCFRRTEQERGV